MKPDGPVPSWAPNLAGRRLPGWLRVEPEWVGRGLDRAVAQVRLTVRRWHPGYWLAFLRAKTRRAGL